MRRVLLFVLVFLFATCVSSFAESLALGKDAIRLGVVFSCEGIDIPDDLSSAVTSLVGDVLEKTNTFKVVSYSQVDAARSRLGFSKTDIGNTQRLAAIGKEANVHFIVWTKVIYDFEKAVKKEAAKGITSLFGVDSSSLIKREKPTVEVSVVESSSAKIVFDNRLKIDLFSSEMKEDMIYGLLGGGSLSSSLINTEPLRKFVKKVGPVMEQAMKEAALLKIQKETDNYEGMFNTVTDIASGKTHNKYDIEAAVVQGFNNNEIDSGKLDTNFTSFTTVTPPVEANQDEKFLVGIMQFQSSNGDVEHSRAALIGDIFTQMLATSNKITIVGRELLSSIATENKLASSGYISPETAREVGRLAGCNVIITGSVTDFTKISKSSGVLIVTSAKEEAKAAANVNVIKVDTGETILSLYENGRAAQSGSAIYIWGITSGKYQINGMEAGAVAELAARLSIKVRDTLTGEHPQVISTSNKEIVFNIGSLLGSRKNALYRVYSNAKGYDETIAIVKVKEVNNDYSVAKIAGKKSGKLNLIREGDKVFPITKKEIQQLVKKRAFVKSR